MRKYLQLTLALLLAAILLFLAWPAQAQGETCEISLFDWTEADDLLGWTIYEQWYPSQPVSLSFDTDHLETFQTGDGGSGGTVRSPAGVGYTIASGDELNIDMEIIGGQIASYLNIHTTDEDVITVFDFGNDGPLTRQVRVFDLTAYAGETIDWLEYRNIDNQNGDRTANLYSITITTEGECEPPGELCPLVENAHFAAETGWLLDGAAVITDGTLTLGPADIAAQNLTLQASTTYNAVISTTDVVSGSTPLNVVLGTDSETLTIEEAGRFTATFTTPSNLVGPIVFGLENEGDDSLILDFACVSLAAADGTQGECIAPENGTFENDSHWNWYRGAILFEPGKFASLPLADNGMIGTSETYTMPTLAEGEHLLLGFTARGLDDGGVISGQITNGSSTVEFNYSTYRAEYTYETSLSTLAEEEDVQLSFVNPGDVITDVLSTADVVMDNVCVFVANRGPNLPTPTDPDGISPLDPGFQGFSSCADLDGIWAGFGVNMAQYRTDYQAGTSVWDPLGWVPWLISAIFVTLAGWACFFFASFLALVDLITYFLNSVMNIGNWFARMWPLFVAWLSLWNNWLAGSLTNISNEIGGTLAAWSRWIGDALWATSETIAMTLAAAVDWIAESLTNLSDWIAGFLSGWSNWIAESLANLSDWLAATLTALWAWLYDFFTNFPGLRTIINWLIEGWNALLAVIGQVLSQILNDLIGIWNDSLQPFLADVWAFISSMPGTIAALLIDFIIAAWDLLKMMFLWLWENVISVGHVPITFYRAFDDGINADPYGLTSCASENFWCAFLSGVQLINQLIAHSTLYPIVIVGIILSTLWILWDNIRELFFSPIEIR